MKIENIPETYQEVVTWAEVILSFRLYSPSLCGKEQKKKDRRHEVTIILSDLSSNQSFNVTLEI